MLPYDAKSPGFHIAKTGDCNRLCGERSCTAFSWPIRGQNGGAN